MTIKMNPAVSFVAAALVELFPDVKIRTLYANGPFFTLSCSLAAPLNSEVEALIEQKANTAQNEASFRSFEMTPGNAAQFFRHHKQPYLAEQCLDCADATLSVFQINNFYQLQAPEETFNKQTIKLLTYKSDRGGYQISGMSFTNPQSAKQFLKANKALFSANVTEELEIFIASLADQSWGWLPRGEQIRLALYDYWKQGVKGLGFALIASARDDLDDLYKNLFSRDSEGKYALYHPAQRENKREPSLGIYNASYYFTDTCCCLCEKPQLPTLLTSLLQFISKTIIMLGFKSHWILNRKSEKKSGRLVDWDVTAQWLTDTVRQYDSEWSFVEKEAAAPGLQLVITDRIGREWVASKIWFTPWNADTVKVGFSLFDSVERIVALLIQENGGKLPLWLAPEQVRIIPVNGKWLSYAQQIEKQLMQFGWRVAIDSQETTLATKVQAAEAMKVPYLVVLGAHEQNTQTLALRDCYANNETREITLEGLQLILLESVKNIDVDKN